MKKRLVILFLLVFSFMLKANIYEYKNTEKTNNSSSVTLLDSEEIDLKEDGSYMKNKIIITKIFNYKGKKDNSEFKIYYDTRYEKLDIKKAKTVKVKDGTYKEIEVEKEAIKYMDAPFESGYQSYAVHKLCVIAFPSVEEGDIVEIEYSILNSKKDKYVDSIIWNQAEFIKKKEYSIKYPENRKIDLLLENNIEGKVEIIRTENKISAVAIDLEKIEKESNRAKLSYFRPVLYISEYKTWQEYSDIIKIQFDKSKLNNSMTVKKAEDLTEHENDVLKKIEIIKDYISQKIENKTLYSLLDFEAREADVILKSSYADSKDRAVLMINMLEALGIKAYPVAIGSEKEYFDKIEKSKYVDDLYSFLVCVEVDGIKYYVDSSSEYYKVGENPYIGNKALLIKDKESKIIEIESMYKNKDNIKYSIEIDKNGGALITYSKINTGEVAALQREKYRYMSPKDKEQDYQRFVSSISQNARGIDWEYKEDGFSTELYYKFYYKDFIVKDGDFIYFNYFSNLQALFLDIEPKDREYPYASFSKLEKTKEIEIKLYDEFEYLIFPENINVRTKLYSVERKVKMEDREINVKDTIIYKSGVVEKDGYRSFYNASLDLSKPVFNKILMKVKR